MNIHLKHSKYWVFLLLLIISNFSFSFLSYRSSVAQNEIIIDSSNEKHNLSFNDIDKMLNNFPNITASALPIDIWRVQYSLWDNNIQQAKKYVKSASKVNPHVYAGEYLQGLIFSAEGNIDSAYFYSKKAFEGWPKNITHYDSYLDILEKKQDTIALIKAFDTLDITLKERPEYFRRFYKSFNKIKLSYLITDFDDQINLNLDDIVGQIFIRGYNFPNGQVIRDTTSSYEFLNYNTLRNQNGEEFLFKIFNDTLNFYFKRDPDRVIAKYFSKYSPKYKTIIFRNVEFQKDKFQDQFFIKSK